MARRWPAWALGGFTALFVALLYLPFVVMGLLSFTGPQGAPTFPLRGTSLYWYQKLFDLPTGEVGFTADQGADLGSYGAALARSLVLAALSIVLSTTLGTLTALAFRRPFRGSGLVFYLFLLGIIIPGVSTGLGLAMFFRQAGITAHWLTTALAGHVLWTLPFCFIIMLITFNRFNDEIEEAARVLGANEWDTFRTVTLPLVAPGLLSCALFAFTLSFDEFARTVFLGGAENTLPLLILASFTVRVTPKLYALGTVTTLVSFAAIALYLLFMARSGAARARLSAAGEEQRRAEEGTT